MPEARSARAGITFAKLGHADNVLTYDLSGPGYAADGSPLEGWTKEQQQELSEMIDFILPILARVYGPPAFSSRVKVVRNLYYQNTNIYLPDRNEIHTGDNYELGLMGHEFAHASRGRVVPTMNTQWIYDPKFSGFEEGPAQAFNRIVLSEKTGSRQVSTAAATYDHDLQPALRGSNFWSAGGAMGMAWKRYEVAAALWEKLLFVNNQALVIWNKLYYDALRKVAKPLNYIELSTVTQQAIRQAISDPDLAAWFVAHFSGHYSLSGTDTAGFKCYHWIQFYPLQSESIVFHRFYLYETDESGTDWADLQPDGTYNYHQLNNTAGPASLQDAAGQFVMSLDFKMTGPDPNKEFAGIGGQRLAITTQANMEASHLYTEQYNNHQRLYESPAGNYRLLVSMLNNLFDFDLLQPAVTEGLLPAIHVAVIGLDVGTIKYGNSYASITNGQAVLFPAQVVGAVQIKIEDVSRARTWTALRVITSNTTQFLKMDIRKMKRLRD